jgi:restriction system protein
LWAKKEATEAVRKSREKAVREKEDSKALAMERTAEAQQAILNIENTLVYTLAINDRIEWDSLIDNTPFPPAPPPERTWYSSPIEPKEADPRFAPVRKWFHIFFSGLRKKAEEEAKRKLCEAREAWLKKSAEVDEKNRTLREEQARSLERWQAEKTTYEKEQAQKNAQIILKKSAYLQGDNQAIEEYCDMVLSNSQYPDDFPQEWNLEYQQEAKTLVLDYFLPSPEDLPNLKEVRYVASKDEFNEIEIQESVLNKMYDSLLYQIALRTIHEIFESDQLEFIAATIFNGWVRSIDKGTGKPVTACILSIQAPKADFLNIDLKHVDPKTCFKTLRGIGSSKLYGLTPIAPILQLNKEDKRFVSSYSVVGDVNHSTNLAAMDWEDFEHLIREVFEKEFSLNGGEVKITQASRDGGVDAVAFDPDPIRGGKIVIQAKRYTMTVGVSAVRDLYGTVVNEGATKGILVTTADYGPDAYSFAKGKPLTLLSGSNLLHLLEKHGHKATIDLKAAKQILADNKKAEEM